MEKIPHANLITVYEVQLLSLLGIKGVKFVLPQIPHLVNGRVIFDSWLSLKLWVLTTLVQLEKCMELVFKAFEIVYIYINYIIEAV